MDATAQAVHAQLAAIFIGGALFRHKLAAVCIQSPPMGRQSDRVFTVSFRGCLFSPMRKAVEIG